MAKANLLKASAVAPARARVVQGRRCRHPLDERMRGTLRMRILTLLSLRAECIGRHHHKGFTVTTGNAWRNDPTRPENRIRFHPAAATRTSPSRRVANIY